MAAGARAAAATACGACLDACSIRAYAAAFMLSIYDKIE
jgi:hypothetical protein